MFVDGYVRAESAISMILQAINADSDNGVHLGILAGTSVNQDGRSGALTAPNGPSQQEVIREALNNAKISPDQISHLQMHGTGTPLGDPIELGAATAVLIGKTSMRKDALQLTSAKSFMGHAEPAAGIVGLSRLSMMLQSSVIDPFITLRNINPHVSATIGSFSGYSVFAPRQVTATACKKTKAGGVSAFAFQGTNAHAVVQEAVSLLKPDSANAILQPGRYWVLPPAHPFGQKFIKLPKKPGRNALEGFLSLHRLNFLMDHAVLGRVLFPATGMLESCLSCGLLVAEQNSDISASLESVTISSPLVIPKDSSIKDIALKIIFDARSGTFALESSSKSFSTKHADGSFQQRAEFMHPKKTVLSYIVEGSKCFRSESQHIAKAVASMAMRQGSEVDGFFVPPSLLDAGLHLGVSHPKCPAKVPISVGRFGLVSCPRRLTDVHACTSGQYRTPVNDTDVASFFLMTGSSMYSSISNLETKVMFSKGQKRKEVMVADYLYEMSMHQVSEPLSEYHMSKVMATATSAQVHFSGESETKLAVSCITPAYAPCSLALEAMHSFNHSSNDSIDVCMNEGITELSTVSSHGRRHSGAALEGFFRVCQTEKRGTRFDIVMRDPNGDAWEMPESRSSKNSVRRISARSVCKPVLLRSSEVIPSQDQVQLRSNPRGSLNTIICEPFEGVLNGPNNVTVAVKSVGINFRDVLNVLGMYPGDPGPPGSDCSGIVIDVGSNVTHLNKGIL